jgi:hypothetical protein
MSQLYKRLINANMPVGEIVAVNRFILTVNGMPS